MAFLGKLEPTMTKTYGFRSRHCPLQIDELSNFEADMMKMIQNIEFKHTRNVFQSQLSADIKSIKNSKEIFVDADKTHNIYKVKETDYRKLLLKNITKTYKKSNANKVHTINKEAKKLVDSLKISDHTEILQE